MRHYFNINRVKKRSYKILRKDKFVYSNQKSIVNFRQKMLPRRFVRFFRRKFKKWSKKKKLKFYIYIRYNYIILYKGKNPRMGKGIGFFVRKSMLLKQNKFLFKFKRYNKNRYNKLSLFFHRKIQTNSYNFSQKWYF